MIANNEGWEDGDLITFFYGRQIMDAVTKIPRARISGWKVMLDTTDNSPLQSVVSATGFSSVGGYLGMSQAISDGAAVWIHCRDVAGSELKVSTQYMYVDSSVLAQYQTSDAFGTAANSYGGINTKAVYLQPVTRGNISASQPTTNTGGTNTGGGSTSGNSGTPTGGDDSGMDQN